MRKILLTCILISVCSLHLYSETFTCAGPITAYDPVDPTKPVGQFLQGTTIEIGEVATKPGFHRVTYSDDGGRKIVAVCRDEDLGLVASPAQAEVRKPESASTNQATNATAQQPLRVLFIGNSYTYGNDIPSIVKQLAAAAKESRVLETGMIAKPAYSLAQHWKDGEALKEIQRVYWDYVVLQEQSGRTIGYSVEGKDYAKLFAAEIKKAKAKPVLFIPWADQDKMEKQAEITKEYQKEARAIGAILAPVGDAWENAINGKPRIVLHASDTHHANPSGSYLAACVFYSLFFNKSPEGLPRNIVDPADSSKVLATLVPADAKRLQSIAWETLQKH